MFVVKQQLNQINTIHVFVASFLNKSPTCTFKKTLNCNRINPVKFD